MMRQWTDWPLVRVDLQHQEALSLAGQQQSAFEGSSNFKPHFASLSRGNSPCRGELGGLIMSHIFACSSAFNGG